MLFRSFPPGYGAPLAGPTHAWGTPEAEFPLETDNCGYDAHFDAHQLVFDLTFCVGAPSLLYYSSPESVG